MNEVKELVEELRNKKSRDNRDLLDRSADMIERLAKELCEKSGCHHKCHNTKDCVVEDEAKAIIGDNLPFALTNEGKVSEKVKQIEEMAKDICKLGISCEECTMLARKTNQTREQYCKAFEYAKRAYNAGYRKQSEGEWQIAVDPVEATFICSKCGYFYIEADPQAKTEYNYCPNCGAKMKGE